MKTAKEGAKWVGKGIKRFEDPRLLTGKGDFVDDLKLPDVYHAAILRSPHAHALIKKIDASAALRSPGVKGVLTGEDALKLSKPFSAAITVPVKYYSMAIHKARYSGEPVAVVVAKDRYIAEDALALIDVDYEPLPAVVDQEEALEPGAPVLHEEVGNNIANHRLLHWGDTDSAFKEADYIVSQRFIFPKYSSTPMETFAIVASYERFSGVLTVRSNFHGPFTLHSVVAKSLDMDEGKLRFIVPPDIGGSFGIKCGIFPYITLIGMAAIKTGLTVKWIEDRREHLLASCSGADRVAYLEAAVKKDGAILGVRAKFVDNNGAYIRAPEPANIYRAMGNSSGAYKFKNLKIEAYAMLTNKSPTGPNRGYGCQQLYFGLERLMDLIADRCGLDPAEVRFRNFISPDQFPYTTPSGGIYDSGDYPLTLKKALELTDYEELKEERKKARAAGRYFGIGIAAAVDPSVSNMAYVTVAIDPKIRASKDYLPKSGGNEVGTVKIDPLGKVTVLLNTAPEGHGHETAVAQIVADELGVSPHEVNVVSEMDTFNRVWTIATGTYSSRFASVGASAFALAARKVREKALKIAAHLLEVSPADLVLKDAMISVKGSPERKVTLKRVAGVAHWHPSGLPEGMEMGLHATHIFNFPLAKNPDEYDHINSSCTYGFIAEVVAVEVSPQTGRVEIKKYGSVHDCGTLINPMLVEGQIYGSMLHGVGGAMYEELAYDADGQLLTSTFADYLCPTAVESPILKIDHVVSPSPFTELGSKGCGESSSMTAPVVIANAVADALAPLGVKIDQLPLPPHKIWSLIKEANAKA